MNQSPMQRLLLVESEPKRLKMYQVALAGAGFEVISATNGPRALEVIAAGEVDLMVTEASIPGGDGIELVRRMCERGAVARVILMLSSLNNETVRRGIEAGAQQYLVKPNAELLAQAVTQTVAHFKRWSGSIEKKITINEQSVTSTQAQNGFGELLDKVIEGQRVVITKYATPKAVVLPYSEYKELTERGARQLNTLSAEFDALLAGMQTREARAGLKAAFGASPAELGKAAVAAARKRG